MGLLDRLSGGRGSAGATPVRAEGQGARARHALDSLGRHDIEVEYVLIRTAQDAAAVPFAGSPTITFDGEDLFPSDGQTSDLACRVYLTENGLAGLPTDRQLEDAIRGRL